MDGNARSPVSDERGFTLVELLTTMVMMTIIMLAAFALFDFAARSQPQISNRSASLRDAQIAMERIERDLRQSSQVLSAAPGQLTVLTWDNKSTCAGSTLSTARSCRVTYSCVSGTCTRTAAESNGTGPGPAVAVATGLAGNSIFTYSPSSTAPESVTITLTVPVSPGSTEDVVTLSGGVVLRNVPGAVGA